MSDRSRAFQIAGVYTAIILGAGFASGQELGSFFVSLGRRGGLLGLVAAGAVFALVGWATLELCRMEDIPGYEALTTRVMGERLGAVMQAAAGLFLFVLFATMFAAGGAAAREAFGVPARYGTLALALLCFATFLLGMEGVVKINAFLAPVMVAGGVFIGLYAFCTGGGGVAAFSPLAGIRGHWLVSAATYASYNTVTAVTVLAALGRDAGKPSVTFWGGALGGLAMTVLGLCLALPLFSDAAALAYEIPLLHIVSRYNAVFRGFYLLVLLAAIYTTASANGFALVETLSGRLNMSGRLLKAIVTIAAVFASQLGFSTFVRRIYPMFGLFGFLQAVMILRAFILLKVKEKRG